MMALDGSSGYAAASSLAKLTAPSHPIFNVERVQLRFSIAADFVAAQVANNVIILALATGRILRIDLDNAEDIDGETFRPIFFYPKLNERGGWRCDWIANSFFH